MWRKHLSWVKEWDLVNSKRNDLHRLRLVTLQNRKEAREAGAQGRTVMEWVMEAGMERRGSYGR